MRKGIARLLRDYYELRSRSFYGGDIDTTATLIDLMGAINGDILTARQRQFIALYYFVGLTFEEVAEVMCISSPTNVSDAIYSALERLSAGPGFVFKSRTPEDFSHMPGAVYRWLDDIGNGTPIMEPSLDVIVAIAEILELSDSKSLELLFQYYAGIVLMEEKEEGEEYPHLSDSQLRWQDRRISLTDEVHPPGDVIGSKRYTPLSEYDGDETNDDEYNMTRTIRLTGRRKLFKLRGN